MNYVAYLIVGRQFGVTVWWRALPLQLCDRAMFVIIVALWTGNKRWLEIAYFWGIGGTLQAIITPNLRFGFPDLRFIAFFVAHSGIIIGIVFLMLVYRFRPRPKGIVRTFLWTEVYFVVAFTVDLLTEEARISPAQTRGGESPQLFGRCAAALSPADARPGFAFLHHSLFALRAL